ncbi:UNVERIFIED_CONTAM: hypothetical protein HDU68_002642 [Siphonaria sp. JEL0065]|nr:hypothetical protein HDU68_002642 [Siphonaria sp. JEL0065]
MQSTTQLSSTALQQPEPIQPQQQQKSSNPNSPRHRKSNSASSPSLNKLNITTSTTSPTIPSLPSPTTQKARTSQITRLSSSGSKKGRQVPVSKKRPTSTQAAPPSSSSQIHNHFAGIYTGPADDPNPVSFQQHHYTISHHHPPHASVSKLKSQTAASMSQLSSLSNSRHSATTSPALPTHAATVHQQHHHHHPTASAHRSHAASREEDLWMIGGVPSPAPSSTALSRASSNNSYMFMRSGGAGASGGGNGSGGNTSVASMKTVDIDEVGGGGSGNGSFGGSNGGIAAVAAWDPSVNIGLATVVASAVSANPAIAAATAPTAGRPSSTTPSSPKPSGTTNVGIMTASIGALFSGKSFSKFSSRKKSLGVCTVSSSISSNNASQTNLVGGMISSNGGATVDHIGLQEAVVQLHELVGKLRTEQYELTRQIKDDRAARIKLEKDFQGLQERLRVLEAGNIPSAVVVTEAGRGDNSNSSASNPVAATANTTDDFNSTPNTSNHKPTVPPATVESQDSNMVQQQQ